MSIFIECGCCYVHYTTVCESRMTTILWSHRAMEQNLYTWAHHRWVNRSGGRTNTEMIYIIGRQNRGQVVKCQNAIMYMSQDWVWPHIYLGLRSISFRCGLHQWHDKRGFL